MNRHIPFANPAPVGLRLSSFVVVLFFFNISIGDFLNVMILGLGLG